MKRINPAKTLINTPCSIVGICTAYDFSGAEKIGFEEFGISLRELKGKLKADGYCTLKDCNNVLRKIFNVKKYVYFKRCERPTLLKRSKEANGKSLICVENHFLYADFDEGNYYSFFDNLNDRIVAEWKLEVKDSK